MAWLQAVYYCTTGSWPLIHMRSFLLITGPKHDLWLVQTVAVLVLAIGAGLGLAAWGHQLGPGIACAGMGAAIGFIAIDVIHVVHRTIAPIYLGDAAVEIVLVAGWLACLAG